MEKNGKKGTQHQREQFSPYPPTLTTMDSPVFLKQNTTSMESSIEKKEVYEIHNNTIHRYFTVKNKVLTFTLNLDSKESCSTLPQDSISISFMRGNYVFLDKEFAHSTPSSIKLNSFQQHIMTLPNWKRSLIKNYNEDNLNSTLVAAIQLQKKLIIIASDGSKSKKVSGGAWIITDMAGENLVSGTNPDFRNIQHIHSHRAEIYGVLSVFTFLQEYSKYYMLTFKSTIKYYYDTLSSSTRLILFPTTSIPSTNKTKLPITMLSYN